MKFFDSKTLFFLIFLLIFNSFSTKAEHKITQKYTYKRYALAEGLPQIEVTHITQDRKGYLWISHWNGLSCFDGFSFENFTQKQGLLGTAAFHALEYLPDSIAVLSFQGISLGSRKGFRSYTFPQSIKGDRNSYIYYLGGKLLITNLITYSSENRRHFYFDLSSGTFEEVVTLQQLFVREIKVLINSFYLCTDDYCFKFRKGDRIPKKKIKWKNSYEDFAVSPSGNFFAYCRLKQKLFKIRFEDQNIEEIETVIKIKDLNDNYSFNRFAITYGDKVLWFDNNNELYLADGKTTESVGRRFGLIRNFYNDREGNLWIATEEGLYNYFRFHFRATKILPGDLSDLIWGISQTKAGNMLYASCNKGLYNVRNQRAEKVNLLPYKFSYEKDSDVDKAFIGAVRSRNGDVFIPFFKSFLRIEEGFRITRKAIEGNPHMLILGRDSDTIYGASSAGMLKIFPDGNTKKIKDGFASYTNESIAEDKYGRFWLGSSQNREIQIYSKGKVTLWRDSLINSVISLSVDMHRNIWIGNHEGVFLYDYKSVRKIASGIIHAPIYSIVPYSDSIMVLGSSQELFTVNLIDLYDKNKETITRSSPNSGFTAEECVQNSYCITDDRALIIPSTNFCYRFFPKDFQPIQTPPPPNIKRIKFTDENQLWQDFTDKNKPKQFNRGLSFSFISIYFKEQSYVSYRYRLLGYQKEWSVPTKERAVNYSNLPFGNYQFEVQASVDGKNWSRSTFSRKVLLPRQFLETWFFRVLFLIVFAALIFFVSRKYFNIRKRKALERQKEKEEITNLQLANIKSQLNPHFIFNVMNHVGSYIVKGKGAETYDYFVKLSHLIRENLYETKKPVKTLEAELAFVERYLYLQKYRFGERLQCLKDIDEGIDQQMLVPRMCLQILVENAIKHGLESIDKIGVINIFVQQDENKVFLIGVTDNGKGFSQEASSEGNGEGLKSLQKILDIYNTYNVTEAKLHIASSKKGSTVMVQIPNNYQFSLK